jgi:outer membrane biosynthesis protein TonB
MQPLLRLLRALWAGLTRRVRRPRPALASPREPARLELDAPPPAPAEPPPVPAAPPPVPAEPLAPSAVAPVVAARVEPVQKDSSSQVEAVVAAPLAVNVRQFFARVAATAPGGLAVDFAAWETAKVERFFLALHSPLHSRRRGPALLESSGLDDAFDGFQWD